MGAGDACRADHVGGTGIGFHQQQILSDRAVEQHRFLGYHTDLSAQGVELDLADVQPIHQYGTFQRAVRAGQEFEQGGFATARTPNQPHESARRNREIHPLQVEGALIAVAEVHAPELHTALEWGHGDVLAFGEGLLRGAVNHVGHDSQGLGAELDLLPLARELGEGAHDVTGEDAGPEKFGDSDLVLNDQGNRNHNEDQLAEVVEKFQ